MEEMDLLSRKMDPWVGGKVHDIRHLHGFLSISPNANDEAKEVLVRRPAWAIRPSALQHAKAFFYLEFSGVCLKKMFQKL
jgi:hypothetical protein